MAIKKERAGVSDYEQQRQEKIAKNQALLQQLQLDAAQTGIASRPKPKASSTAGQKRKRAVEKVKQEEGPRRTSARLQGIVADSEVAREKEEHEAVVLNEQLKARRMRKSEPIHLDDANANGATWNRSGNWLSTVGPANPGERTFTAQDIKDTTSKELRELRERMSSLQLWEGAEPNRIKITPERIYSLSFHPTPDKQLVFAGDKLGNLGLFDGSQTTPQQIKNEDDEDAEDEEEIEPAITGFKIHTRTISAFNFAPADQNIVYTASYDSSIRALDLTKGVATEAYAPSDHEADEPLSGVELSPQDPHTLHFTTLNGAFGTHDLRTPSHQTATLAQLAEKKIGGFSLHPTEPHLMATASLDRTLKLWDLRQMGKDGTPACLASHASKLSVSHAAFNTAGQIATASYDDTIKIHHTSPLPTLSDTEEDEDAVPDFPPTTIIPHNNQTGRWVTILRAQWQQQPSDGIQRFAIGNMNRFVDVFTGRGEQVAQLGGEGVTAVPAVARFHDRRDWVAAGTASGKLCLWV